MVLEENSPIYRCEICGIKYMDSDKARECEAIGFVRGNVDPGTVFKMKCDDDVAVLVMQILAPKDARFPGHYPVYDVFAVSTNYHVSEFPEMMRTTYEARCLEAMTEDHFKEALDVFRNTDAKEYLPFQKPFRFTRGKNTQAQTEFEKLNSMLELAVANERYEKAAELRDALKTFKTRKNLRVL